MGFLNKLFGKGSAKQSDPMHQSPKDTAYVMWSCLDDGSSCDECRALDGTCWIPGLAEISEAPLTSCRSPEGCRCMEVYVSTDELGASDVADFIRASGGKVTSEQLAKHQDSKEVPLRDRSERQHAAAAKAFEANKIEKDKPEDAIALYHESIQIHRELAEVSEDQWSWQDFTYLYNRLTLVLEKLGRFEEVIHQISVFETLPCQDQGAKSDRDAIEKRKTRLTKKLGRYKDGV